MGTYHTMSALKNRLQILTAMGAAVMEPKAAAFLLGQPFQGQLDAPDQLLGGQVRWLGSADDGRDDVGGQEGQGQQVAEIAGVDALDRRHPFDRCGSARKQGLQATTGAANFFSKD